MNNDKDYNRNSDIKKCLIELCTYIVMLEMK